MHNKCRYIKGCRQDSLWVRSAQPVVCEVLVASKGLRVFEGQVLFLRAKNYGKDDINLRPSFVYTVHLKYFNHLDFFQDSRSM